MASLQYEQPTRWERVKRAFADLAFITDAFKWFLLLLSRLAEPLMFLATLYVIAETVLPTIFAASLFHNVSDVCIIVLNLAPEIIMPGCFLRARSVERRDAWKFNGLGLLFLGLTLVTLVSFVYKASPQVIAVILLVRCAAGVLYALVSMMSSPVEQEAAAPKFLTALQEELEAQRQRLETHERERNDHETRYQALLTQSAQSQSEQLQELAMSHELQLQTVVTEMTTSHEARTQTLLQELLAQINEQHEQRIEAMQQTITRVAVEQVTTTVTPLLSLPQAQPTTIDTTLGNGTKEDAKTQVYHLWKQDHSIARAQLDIVKQGTVTRQTIYNWVKQWQLDESEQVNE